MNNATDTAVSSFFSDEAERIKKRSWTSLWIGFAVAVPCVLIIIPGFFLLFIVPLWGALILFASFVGFVVGMVFILRFAYLRMKLVSYVGAQGRRSQTP